MVDLRIAHRFFGSKLYSKTRNLRFIGQLMAQPLTENTGYFLLARRMLKLDADSPVSGGEIIRTVSGQLYVSQAHATSEINDNAFYKTLRMYEVTDKDIAVTVADTVDDSILGTKADDGPQKPWGTIDAVIESTALEHDNFKNIAPTYRVITNQNVPIGAIIGDTYRVTYSDYRGGCYFLTAQKL